MRYVIIGASAAGINAASTLRFLDPEGDITVISTDKDVYSRCMLHLVISGERDTKGISFIEDDFFQEKRINWLNGVKVSGIDEDSKAVILKEGSRVPYDRLLIASGASATIPPVKNLREAANVSCLRNIEDVKTISERCRFGDNVVIIGAGLVGIDAAAGLMHKGVNVHLVEMADRILPLQLDKKAAQNYEKLFKSKNVDIITGASVQEVVLDKRGDAREVVLNSGVSIPCRYIIVAAGVRPNVEFLSGTSVKVDKGVIIDSYCRTTAGDIYAAGDVTALAPIWPAAVRQGKAAAMNMAGFAKQYESVFASQNTMNFLGLPTVSIGIIEAPDSSYVTEISESKRGYKKIIHKDGIIYGAMLQGDIAYCGVLDYLITNKVNISAINKSIFDLSFADFYDTKTNGEYIYGIN